MCVANYAESTSEYRIIRTAIPYGLQAVRQVHQPLKINLANPRWRTADTLERSVLYHHEIS